MPFRPFLVFFLSLIGALGPVTPAVAQALQGSARIEAERIEGVNQESVEALGQVHLTRDDLQLWADRLRYRILEDDVEAEGQVRLHGPTYQIDGPSLRFKLTEKVGSIERPNYMFQGKVVQGSPLSMANFARGSAERVLLEGENQYRMHGATFSTCKPGDDSWFARFSQLNFDYDRDEGEGWGAKVVFKGVPIFYVPYLSFPLNRDRHSGFLAPTWGNTTTSGLELTVPYYWNIAPAMDATFFPHYYVKRGLQLGSELRYLNPDFAGDLQGALLPNDPLREMNRWSVRWRHRQDFMQGLAGYVDFNRVSDHYYYTDLASQISVSAQTQLAQQGGLNYAWDGWSVTARALRYQTLQTDPLFPVTRPYMLLPQIVVNGRTLLTPYVEAALQGDVTRFQHPESGSVEGLKNVRRAVLYPKISFPYIAPGYYLTPRFGVHLTRYAFEHSLTGLGDAYQRAVPILSLDSGLVFERPLDGLGRRQIQTLEPRLFYLRVPYRSQEALTAAKVNFDSGAQDFNFAQMFAENIYSGHDRIADANQLTLAVSSRLLDAGSGKEYFRAMLGQRYYFSEQRVTLNADDSIRSDKRTDILGALSGELLPKVYLDAAAQYKQSEALFGRFNIAARYQPMAGQVLNLTYRFSRAPESPFTVDVRNIDLSGQWPLLGRWQSVGRYNYSVLEQRVIETLAGIEYFAGCWSTRFVVQRFATSSTEYKTAIFLQLELTDFGRFGTNPMEAINRGVSGYSRNGPSVPVAGETGRLFPD